MPFDATPTNTTADVLRRARAVIGDVPLLQIAQDHVFGLRVLYIGGVKWRTGNDANHALSLRTAREEKRAVGRARAAVQGRWRGFPEKPRRPT